MDVYCSGCRHLDFEESGRGRSICAAPRVKTQHLSTYEKNSGHDCEDYRPARWRNFTWALRGLPVGGMVLSGLLALVVLVLVGTC